MKSIFPFIKPHFRKSILIVFLIITAPNILCAGKVGGRITDLLGQGLPFATLYIQGTTIGTTSNARGYFSLDVPNGQHTLVFQYVGYKTLNRKVDVGDARMSIQIVMEPETIQLQEVVVNANENPAERVIKETINKRKFHLEQIEAYSCDVYIKGLQTLEKRPDKIFGVTVTIDTGIVYLSESVSKFSYKRPDKIKETMISSKVSGFNSAFSFNQASEMMVNIYENLYQYEGLTQRGIVSPIAQNAFLFYDYEMVGTITEDNLLINKIRVIPKRKNDPVVAGYIYIIEDSWKVHSLDVMLTKDNQIEFLDTLRINQVYAPVTQDIWMLLSQKFTFDLNIFGFQGEGSFVSVYSNYEVQPNFSNKYFSKEVLAIKENANERDSTYWESIRPIPLTALERNDYQFKDSLAVIRDSKDYKDSVDRVTNKLTGGNILMSGYTHSNSFKEKYYHINSLTEMFQYNTVEGLVVNMNMSHRKNLSRERFYRIRPTIRYGFGNERLNALLNLQYHFNRKRFSAIETTFGRFVAQFNEGAISPLINTFETLVLGDNHMKLYGRNFWEGKYRSELTNGVMFTGDISYSDRTLLSNTSDYSFRNEDKVDFTSNNPDNLFLTDTSFPDHQALKASLQLRFVFDQRYISRPDRKIIYETKYPVIHTKFTRGFNMLGSDVEFNQLKAWVTHEWFLGLLGESDMHIESGFFFGPDQTAFPDYEHFDGNRTYFAQFDINNFQLLDYYRYSTNDSYFAGHFSHHFNGFIFNKLPLLRKLKLQSVASAHYLKVPGADGYLELGFGIEHIFKIARIDFFTSVLDVKRSGVRVGIGF
ncbi:MAG: DUF5686 and carboxypeptidase regulatory-like domain-containing protein [Cyclobacteriaceae bacterium]